MSDNNTATLCHMAWDYPMYFMFTNSIGYCCRTPRASIDNELLETLGEDYFSNSPQFVDRRRALLDGIKHSDCNTCWKLEDAGFKSSRSDTKMSHFMNKNDPTFSKATPISEYKNHQGLEKSSYANCIELVLNNTCDAKCTYCSEFYSTQWLSEKQKFNAVSPTYTPQTERNARSEELFWSWYENKVISTTQRFGFIGGEPLIIDALYECFDILLKIHERRNTIPLLKKTELCITSNLNTPPAYFTKFLNYLPQLEKYFTIIIQVSGENIGADLEYIRHGVKWKRWSSNIEYLLEHTTVTLAFLPCLNLLSIPRFSQYLTYVSSLCKKYKLMTIHDNIVTWPIEQSPMIAPREFAKYFDESIEVMSILINSTIQSPKTAVALQSYQNIITWLEQTKLAVLNNPSELQLSENSTNFYKFFKILDDRRNTNVLAVIPEIAAFYESGRTVVQSARMVIPIQSIKN